MLNLIEFKNKHCGEDVIVMGSGPSLNTANMEILPKSYIIGYNASFEKCLPTYFTTVDPTFPQFDVARNLATSENKPFFICTLWKKNLHPQRTNEFWFPEFKYPCGGYKELHSKDGPMLSKFKAIFDDCTLIEEGVSSICSGIPELAIPLAFYMGFERIFLIGVDYTPKHLLTPNNHHFNGTPKQFDKIKILSSMLKNDEEGFWDSKRWSLDLWLESNKADRIFNLAPETTLNFKKANWSDVHVKYL